MKGPSSCWLKKLSPGVMVAVGRASTGLLGKAALALGGSCSGDLHISFQTQDFLAPLSTFPNQTAPPWEWGNTAMTPSLPASLSG